MFVNVFYIGGTKIVVTTGFNIFGVQIIVLVFETSHCFKDFQVNGPRN